MLLFIFGARSQFSAFCYLEFFNFRTLEKFCTFRLKSANIFCILKYFLYLCNAVKRNTHRQETKKL